jgi:hypothetical protein
MATRQLPKGFQLKASTANKLISKKPNTKHREKKLEKPAATAARMPSDTESAVQIFNVGFSSFLAASGKQVSMSADCSSADSRHDWRLVPAVGDGCYYVVSVGANKFLDTHGSVVWTWGDGKDVGEFPAQITWRLVPVAATSSLCYLINVASHRYLEAHRAGARVSIGSGRRQNLQWEIRRA